MRAASASTLPPIPLPYTFDSGVASGCQLGLVATSGIVGTCLGHNELPHMPADHRRQPPVDHIARTREQYSALGYPAYQWVPSDDAPPFAPLRKPVSQSKLGLIGSGGIYASGQVAFHHQDDTSFRIIDTDLPAADLRATHFAYDLTDARRDPDVVFPIGQLKRMVASGQLGALARNAYAFMGGIYSARRVREKLAPAIADRVVADQLDLALLVPV